MFKTYEKKTNKNLLWDIKENLNKWKDTTIDLDGNTQYCKDVKSPQIKL